MKKIVQKDPVKAASSLSAGEGGARSAESKQVDPKPTDPAAMPKKIVDPAKYARMSVPFESQEEMDAAIAEFTAGVRALREKCRIADVYVIIALPKPKQRDDSFLTTFNCGSSAKRLPMTAAAFGFEKSNHDKMINDLINKTHAADD